MNFWIHIEFTKVVGQFRQKDLIFFFLWNGILSYFFNIVNFIFVDYNTFFEYIIEKASWSSFHL
jgi:hypothetical protein